MVVNKDLRGSGAWIWLPEDGNKSKDPFIQFGATWHAMTRAAGLVRPAALGVLSALVVLVLFQSKTQDWHLQVSKLVYTTKTQT